MATRQDAALYGQNLAAAVDKIGGAIKEQKKASKINSIISRVDPSDINSVGNASTMLIGMGEGNLAQGLLGYYSGVETDKANKLKREMFKHQNKYEYDVLVQNNDPRVVPTSKEPTGEVDALGRPMTKDVFGKPIVYDELVDYKELSGGKTGKETQPYSSKIYSTQEGMFHMLQDDRTGETKITPLGENPIKESKYTGTNVNIDATPEYELFYYKEGNEEKYVKVDRQSGKVLSSDPNVKSLKDLNDKNLRKVESDSPKK